MPKVYQPSARKTGKRKANADSAAPSPASKRLRRAAEAVGQAAAAPAPAKGKARGAALSKTAVPERSAGATGRRPAPKTFLVAATVPGAAGAADLQVYAAVTRGTEEALAVVRETLGPDVAVELTGKLSGRMAKALSLKPGDVRRI